MKKVRILLATYNGEKYLCEQLDSLVSQTYQNIEIFIRDDGSSDKTIDILKKYEKEYSQMIHIIKDDENLGYPDCFWRLLEISGEVDYYAFCDQDDVWHAEKIERAVKMLEKETNPALYIHDYELCDGNLECFGTHSIAGLEQIRGEQLIFYTIAQGFSMIINQEMRGLLLGQEPMGKKLPHDGWCIWNAYYVGKIVYDPTILACYRRHEHTVTSSAMKKGSQIKSWIDKEILGKEMGLLENRAQLFIEYADQYMSKEEKAHWELLTRKKVGIATYLKRLFFPKRLRPSMGGEIALRILFLLGK